MALLQDLFSILPTWPVWASIFCVVATVVVARRRYWSSLSDLPGPLSASFSRLWHLVHIFTGDHAPRLLELHRRHGPFIRISHNEVSVCHPEAITKVLLNPLQKAPWYKVMAMPDYRFQNPFSTLEPKAKIERSKQFAAAYTLTNLLQSESEIDVHVLDFKEWLDRFAESRTSVDLSKSITYATYDIAGDVLFSKPFGFQQAGMDIGNSISNAVALNLYAGVAGFSNVLHTLFIGNPIVTSLKLLPMGHLFNTTIKALDERRSNNDARFDMLSHWLKAHENDPHKLTAKDIYAYTTIAVGASADTISIGIQSFIYHVIRNAKAIEQLRNEFDTAQAQGLLKSPVVTFADAQKLPFLQACIKESQRLFNPIAFGLAREVGAAGLDIGGRFFPSGTILSVNSWIMHRSKEIWGPDADEFNPNRWFDKGIEVRERYFIPFGAGYGSCPGQNLAKIELSKICATLLRDYDIHQVNPDQEWKWKARVSVMPHSWPVYIRGRNQ